MTIEELAAATGVAANAYEGWDDDKSRACKCDARYTGIDCTERMCPKGDDPLSVDVDLTQTTTTSLQVKEVQNVTAQMVTREMYGGQVTFSFTDLYNGEWTTRPIELPLPKSFENANGMLRGQQFEWQPLTMDFTQTMATNDKIDFTNTGEKIKFSFDGAASKLETMEGVSDSAYALGNNRNFFLECIHNANTALNAACGASSTGYWTVASGGTTYTTNDVEVVVSGSTVDADAAVTAGIYRLKAFQSLKATSNGVSTTIQYIDVPGVADNIPVYRLGVATMLDAATINYGLRRGDQIMIAKLDGSVRCPVEVAKDVGLAANGASSYSATNTYIYIKAHPTAAACLNQPANDYTLYIFTQWTSNAWGAGGQAATANKPVYVDGSTSYVTTLATETAKDGAVTGTLTLAGTTASVTDLAATLLPGTWLRIYDDSTALRQTEEGDSTYYYPGPYCDVQVYEQPSSGSSIKVRGFTSTFNQGKGNATVASSACTDFSGETFALAHLKNHKYLAKSASSNNVLASTAGTQTDDFAITVTHGVGSVTSDSNFVQADIDALQPGVVVGFATWGSSLTCVAQVLAAPASTSVATFKIIAPPAKYTDSKPSGFGLTSCVTAASTTLTNVAAVVFNEGGTLYYSNTDANNFEKFQDLTVGDVVVLRNTVSGAWHADSIRGHDATPLVVENRGPVGLYDTTEVDGSAIVFASGSLPNGGGMLPVMTAFDDGVLMALDARSRVTDTTTSNAVHGDGVYHQTVAAIDSTTPELERSTTLDVFHTTNCTWCALDTDTTDSAKDVQRVLNSLPNQVIPEVEVTMTSNTLSLYSYNVSFPTGVNSGNQHKVTMNVGGCNVDGCQPRYRGMYQLTNSFASTAMTVSASTTILAGTMTFTCTSSGTDISAVTGMSVDGNIAQSNGVGSSITSDFLVLNGQNTGTNMNKLLNVTSVAASGTTGTITFLDPTSASSSGVVGVKVVKALGDRDNTDHSLYFKAATYEITRGTTESSECSGRGLCDGSAGICDCFKGYHGEACSKQTVLL
jgi:hypothetical protein